MPVTLKDIARRAGVSVTTVSRALAGYDDVAQATRQRIHQIAHELGYQPNVTARRLQKQRTETLGFVLPTYGPRLSDPFFSQFLAGLGNEAALHDYDLLVSTHAPNSGGERQAYRRAVSGSWVDGLIVVRTRVNDARIRLLHDHGFPFVAFGRTADPGLAFAYVDEDGFAGMQQLTEHLLAQGHRRIAFITPPADLMFGQHRRQGYRAAMAEAGLDVRPEWLVEGDMTERGGAEAVERLLELRPRPTAILGGNDLMALGAMSRIRQRRLRVGRDIAIAGFDDIPPAAYAVPPLTTIHQPIFDIARTLCQMLIDFLAGRSREPQQILLKPTLIVRESTRPGTLDRRQS